MSNKEILSYKRQLDYLFKEISNLDTDLEMQSHWARYLCIRVSGFLEVAVSTIYKNYAKDKAAPFVVNYVNKQLSGFQNPNMEKILNITRAFSVDWAKEIELELGTNSEIKDSIDSIVEIRNKIAHGDNVGITYSRMQSYYKSALKLIKLLEEQCNR